MYAREVIEILKDKTHPKRAEVARHLVSFLSDGIFGMCFGAQVNRGPAPDQDAKRTQVLEEMTQGDDTATAHVVEFIEDDPNSFSVSFTDFLESGAEYTFRRN
jgi:hypothetical protein